MMDISIPDKNQIAQHLSAALQFETVSYDDHSPGEPFLVMHRFLKNQYPLVSKHLKRETVNQLSLLYTWEGSEPDLPAVAFLAHMDVVPADAVGWTHPPFSGMVSHGFIWGRGVIDMKSQLITLLEAVEALLTVGFKPRRSIYLAFGHDEEVGGQQGARAIATLLQSRNVRLDALMDEGGGVAGGVAPGIEGLIATIAYAEKAFANIKLEAKAHPGHASTPQKTNAIGLLSRAIIRLEKNPMPTTLEFLQPTIKCLMPYLTFPFQMIFNNLWLTGGLVKLMLAQEGTTNAMMRNTIAPTILQSGYKSNVMPEKASVVLNCRLLPGYCIDDLLEYLQNVIKDPRITIKCIDTSAPSNKPVSIHTTWYQDLERRIAELFSSVPICPMIMTGGSDARHYQDICKNIYHFQPITFQKPSDDLTHGIDERVEVEQLPVMVKFNARMMLSWGCK